MLSKIVFFSLRGLYDSTMTLYSGIYMVPFIVTLQRLYACSMSPRPSLRSSSNVSQTLS